MELKGRLKLIAHKTPVCNILGDIGTDHGYIPIYLVKNNTCKRAIACDIRKGPLLAAANNVKSFGMEEHIETRLGDGLKPLNENEAQVIIIAGMGGYLISKILTDGFSKAKTADALILQPMNEINTLREWLYANGFEIYDEELINEGEKIYNVICTRWTGEIKELDRVYYHVGQKLVERKGPLLDRLLQRRIGQLEKIIDHMGENTGHMDVKKGYEDLLKDLREIKSKI
jgi:tRNA (adenine22-N1)-methyltransferase